MIRTVRLASGLLVVSALASTARGQTWVGPGTDWNTAINWSPQTVPNSATAAVSFTGTGPSTLNISSSVQTQSLSFTNPTGNYTITSNNTATLTTAAITVAAVVTGTQTINLANTGARSLLIPPGSGTLNSLAITNNSTAAGNTLVIGPNTIIGMATFNNIEPTLLVYGPGTTAFTGAIDIASGHTLPGLLVAGPGTFDYGGDGSGLTGEIWLAGGTLVLDYAGNAATKMGGAGQLLLNGGGVITVVPNISTAVTQGFAFGTTIAGGHTDFQAGGTLGTVTLALGSISRDAGATVDVSPGSGFVTFNVTTSAAVTNGLLGAGPAFATFGRGTTWATVSAGTIVGLTTYGTNTYAAGTNTDVTTSAAVVGITTNSLRFNTGNPTLSLSGTNILQSGGILVTPNATGGTITGGTLTGTSAGELIVHQYSGGSFVINSTLSGSLTKTGPGTLVLGGNNTGLTGLIAVNRGNLTVTNAAAVNSASAIDFLDTRMGAALQTFTVDLGNFTNGTITPNVFLSASSPTGYGTVFSTGASAGSRVSLNGAIDSGFQQFGGQMTTPLRFTGFPSNTSGFNLSSFSTFINGPISLLHGYLGINSDASLGTASNTLFLEVGDTNNGGLEFLNSGAVAHPVVLNATTRVLSDFSNSNTISSAISGVGGLVKAGTGTLILSNPNNSFGTFGGVTVSTGTLSLGNTGGLAAGTNLTVTAGATFTASASTSPLQFGTITLNGGTLRANGTGQTIGFNQITTDFEGGTVDFTGAGTDSLTFQGGPAITINGNSTWLSPANTTAIANPTNNDLVFNIHPGVTLTNGIALTQLGAGFLITGGGTLYQNCDAANAVNMFGGITVTQAVFRVTDVTSDGGRGNLGASNLDLVLDGGAFFYGGPTASTAKAIFVTINNGVIDVESAGTTLTATGPIAGPVGGLTKTGPGTLALTLSNNSFASLTITAGAVQTANDNTLGAGSVTIGPNGMLSYTGSSTTGRTFAINSGTMTIAAGQTLTLNGATVGGGFLRGAGTYAVTGGSSLSGVTTFASTTINQTGAGTYTNFANGGTLNIAPSLANGVAMNGFSNEGSGSITVGAVSKIGVADFQSYGTLTLNPAAVGSGTFTELTNTGTTPLFFNGGSRTFLGTPQTATQNGQPTFVAGIDLHGQNAVVAGGLFVNNGFVVDSTNGGLGTATIIVDFGALVKGAGYYQNSVITQNGGKFQAGNSPGRAVFGQLTVGPGGVQNFNWQINNANGLAGPLADANNNVSGWSQLQSNKIINPISESSGNLTWTATSALGSQFNVSLETLLGPLTAVGTSPDGPMSNFDPTRQYVWPFITWQGVYSGPANDAALTADTNLDPSEFANPIKGAFTVHFDGANSAIDLVYTPTPVPEPGTLILTGVGAIGWATYWRRRSRA